MAFCEYRYAYICFTLQPDSSKVEIVVSLLENLDNPHHIITSVFIETFTRVIGEMVHAITCMKIMYTHDLFAYRVPKAMQEYKYKKCTRWTNTEK